MNFCSACGTRSQADARYCAQCGNAIHARGYGVSADAAAAAGTTAPVQALSPERQASSASTMGTTHGTVAGERYVSSGTAIAALLLNILVWPGLGSLVAGENVGWAQGLIFLFGIPFALIFVGIPMMVGAWIWALITGIRLIQRADAQAAAGRRA